MGNSHIAAHGVTAPEAVSYQVDLPVAPVSLPAAGPGAPIQGLTRGLTPLRPFKSPLRKRF